MFKKKCDIKGCDKEIEGYTENHVSYLMQQHLLKHKLKPKGEALENGSS